LHDGFSGTTIEMGLFMTHAIALLTQDHDQIKALFSEFAENQDMHTAALICDHLMAHIRAEDELVYPILATFDEGLAADSAADHADAKYLIARIQSSAGEGDAIEAVSLLGETFSAHVAVEVDTAFPLLLTKMSDAELTRLGDQIAERKRMIQAT
jgi:hemerythrin-like domain-containing protein